VSEPAASTEVATYQRTVAASLDRVWENVLDWEHLPWLHRDTFAAVRPRHAGRDGWCAEVELQPAGGAPLVIDVALDRGAQRYHTRTVDGPGAGTDIVTTLTPAGDGQTHVHVAFHVPGIAPEAARAVGAVYQALYAKLWDEDEAMMVRRQALLDRRCEPAWREVAVDGRAVRFLARCPHLGGPLDTVPVEDGCITCPWHGYRFDLRTGSSTDGRGLRLCLA
jgi:phenylpropionate dioxygenase-like ring-hydroxylating dioxygenase large terminal subunit